MPIPTPTTKKKTLQEILAESTAVAQNAAKVAGLPAFKPGYTIPGQTPENSTENPQNLPIKDVVAGKTGTEKTPQEALTERLTKAIETQSGFKPVERYQALRQEAGLPAKEETLSKYDTEINKTFDLLDNLEKDINQRTGGFLVSEAERRRITATEQAPLLKGLETAQRGKTALEGEVTRKSSEVEKILGLEKEAAGQDLETMKSEATLLNLLKKNEEVELDTFTDETGNRVATLWDKDSGKTRNVILGKAKVTEPTKSVTEKQAEVISAEVKKADVPLMDSRGEDGYADPGVYMKYRTEFAKNTGGNVGAFDNVYSSFLSPQERARLGIGKSTSTAVTGAEGSRLQELLKKSNNGEDIDSLTPDEQAELYSLL